VPPLPRLLSDILRPAQGAGPAFSSGLEGTGIICQFNIFIKVCVAYFWHTYDCAP